MSTRHLFLPFLIALAGIVSCNQLLPDDQQGTPRGYVTPKEARGILRRVAVKHTPQEMEAELNTIVDNGCTVIDVIVDHPIYGQLTGPLQISNRYEVSQFIERCKKAEPLSSLTDGIHLHTLSCPDEAAFERTKSALRALRVLLEENGN